MKYNWQMTDWPLFRYDLRSIEDLLYRFAEKAGLIGGLVHGLPEAARQEAVIDMMVSEAIKTSQIEGENLVRSDVMSSIRNNLGLNPVREKVGDKKAQGVGELMVKVRKTFADPMSEEMLFDWHSLLLGEFAKRMKVGGWRDHEDPMQIISGAYGKETVHFEALPSSDVPHEMARFIEWFNNTAPTGKTPIKYPPVRAAIAHLYFESIHPFEDGNGRIGRAISEKALSQGLGRPVIMSLSKAIEAKRKDYYDALQAAQASNDITPWIRYFVETCIQAQEDAEKIIEFILFKTRLFDKFASQLNDRQTKAINRMLADGIDGFKGGMRTQKYMKITSASKATTARDLQHLVVLGVLRQVGEGRSTHYLINPNGIKEVS